MKLYDYRIFIKRNVEIMDLETDYKILKSIYEIIYLYLKKRGRI